MRRADDLIWGVNGHPFTAYPDIAWESQLDLVLALGMTHYRINTRGDGSRDYLAEFLPLAQARGVSVVPILYPDVDLDADSPQVLERRSFALAREMAGLYRGRMPVWELANELESYAILQPCEMRDDGTQYHCEWGPAGGVGADEYFGPRWEKVSAVLKGLSRGVAAGDPKALRAAGTAGWGHLGAFERLAADGVAWDITVWHDYEGVTEEYLGVLAGYGKPIWITEFNAGGGGFATPEENAKQLLERIAYYRAMRTRFGVTAAFIYELLDEDYWGDTFEARMGLYELDGDAEAGWRVGAPKPAAAAVRAAIADGGGASGPG